MSGDFSGLNSGPCLSGIEPLKAAAKSGLNRSMLDQGLGQLRTMLEEKAKERGRLVIPVDPKKSAVAAVFAATPILATAKARRCSAVWSAVTAKTQK